MVLEKAIDAINEDDIKNLKTENVSEIKTLEYKRDLPTNSYDSKKEFLADASSFANAGGGHLIFGIEEENGLPKNIIGFENIDPDAEILRLENLIRDNIEPRIQGVSMRAIALSTKNTIILIRIPQSWTQPHVVNYQKHWRFYTRNSAGKYPLDLFETRGAFALSNSLPEKAKDFRNSRIGKLIEKESPVPLGKNALIVLQIIPFGSFNPSTTFNLNSIENITLRLNPIYGGSIDQRYNYDGLIIMGNTADDLSRSYIQIFRNGIIETVNTNMLRSYQKEAPTIPSGLLEQNILSNLSSFLAIQKQLGISPPFFTMLSLIGVKGFNMAVKHGLDTFKQNQFPIDRDVLLFQENIIEDYETDLSRIMKPNFDAIWNATGWPRSMNYDELGNWGKGPNSHK